MEITPFESKFLGGRPGRPKEIVNNFANILIILVFILQKCTATQKSNLQKISKRNSKYSQNNLTKIQFGATKWPHLVAGKLNHVHCTGIQYKCLIPISNV